MHKGTTVTSVTVSGICIYLYVTWCIKGTNAQESSVVCLLLLQRVGEDKVVYHGLFSGQLRQPYMKINARENTFEKTNLLQAHKNRKIWFSHCLYNLCCVLITNSLLLYSSTLIRVYWIAVSSERIFARMMRNGATPSRRQNVCALLGQCLVTVLALISSLLVSLIPTTVTSKTFLSWCLLICSLVFTQVLIGSC